MYIGIDCRMPFYRLGGISQYIMHLIPALAEVDEENWYNVYHLWKDKRSYLPFGLPRFQRFNWLTPCHHRWETTLVGLELLADPRPMDVLHSPDFIPPRFGAKRRVITVHDLNFLHYPQYLTEESKRYYADQIEWAVGAADHIIADSEHTRQDLISMLTVAPDKVTTIHLAANPLYAEPPDAAEMQAYLDSHGLEPGYILSVGTLEPRKNLETLFKAYKQLLDAGKIEVPLVLAGQKGWLYESIFDTVAELGLKRHVIHLEGAFDVQLAYLYRAAGVLVTPSHYEGFGLPALEAQTCGCPVVVSDRGSLPEIVGDGGIVLPADDSESWASALEEILSDRELAQTLIEKGHLNTRRFNWRRTAEATLEVYRQVH